jgi:predicted aspartyl protease
MRGGYGSLRQLQAALAGLLVTLAALTWTCSALRAQTENIPAGLDALLQQKDYLELENALAHLGVDLSSPSLAYFDGVMANRVNQVQKSVGLLEPLISILLKTNPARAEVALCTLADDYAKTFRYANAATFYARANRVAEQQQRPSECGAGSEASRWNLLRKAPVQTLQASGGFIVRGKKDELGLFQIPVASGNYTGTWIVDSGANLSVISRSVANKIGIATSASNDTAQTEGRLSVMIHTAVIPEIRLGPATLRNVAVLVVEDSNLSFPRFNYRIDGCLGLPALEAFGTITFYHNGRVRFGSAEKAADKGIVAHNFFLEKFTPLIAARFGNERHLFTFDTGAMGTILSAKFFEENPEIVSGSKLVRLELMGAGGTVAASAFEVSSLVIKFDESCAKINAIDVLTGATEASGRLDDFYGEIGENALTSLSSFTLDFQTMHFTADGEHPDCPGSGILLYSGGRRSQNGRADNARH